MGGRQPVMEREMTKLRAYAVAVAFSAAATVAIAQPAPSPESRMAVPSAADPQVRNNVMAAVKAAPAARPQSGDVSSPRGQSSVANGAAASIAPLRGTPPVRH